MRLFSLSSFRSIVMLPAIFLVVCSFSYPAQNVKWEGDTVLIFNGNIFRLPANRIKVTDSALDPVTGKWCNVYSERPAIPLTMNGEKIYTSQEVSIPSSSLEEYLLTKITQIPQLLSQPDGVLKIGLDDIVVDKNGRIAYYVYDCIRYTGADKAERTLVDDKMGISDILENAPALQPATVNGNNVALCLDISLANYKVVIKDHIITYTKI